MLKIKLILKNKSEVFKIKKFPVYLGSGRGENIIPFRISHLAEKHCKFELIKGRVYLRLLSNGKCILNGEQVKTGNYPVKPGINNLQVDNYLFQIENDFIRSTRPVMSNKTIIIASAAACVILAAALVYIFKPPDVGTTLTVAGIKNQYYAGERASVEIKVNAEDALLNIYLGKKSYKNIPVMGALDSVVTIPLADTGSQVINVRLLDSETKEEITKGISKTFYVNQKKIEWKIIQPKKILNVGEKTNLTINVLSKGIFKLKIKSDSNLDTKEYDINKQKTVQLLYEKPGDKKVEVTISDGKVTETRQIFYTIKGSEELIFKISSTQKTIIIENYKEIEKYIKTIDWRDGTSKKMAIHEYKSAADLPEFIIINNKKYSTNKK